MLHGGGAALTDKNKKCPWTSHEKKTCGNYDLFEDFQLLCLKIYFVVKLLLCSSFIHLIHLHTRYTSWEIRGETAVGGPEIPNGQQQSQISVGSKPRWDLSKSVM